MNGFAAAVLVALAHFATRDAWPEDKVLLLKSEATGIDRQRLLETAAIYTRDLGLSVEEGPEAPAVVSPEELRRLRGPHTRLAFWCRRSPGDPQVKLHVLWFTSGGHRVEELSFPVDEGQDLYRAIGLKLRSLLVARRPPGAAEPGTSPRAQPRAAAAAETPALPPAPGGAATPRWLAAIGYAWLPALAATPGRHGLTLQAAWLPSRGLELWVGADVTTRPTAHIEEGTATLVDVPARAGARVRLLSSGPFQSSGGPTLSLHLLSVSGVGFDGDRASASVFRAVPGAGVDVVGRMALSSHIAVETRVWLEVLLARTRFVLRGSPALETGRLSAGVGAGLAIFP